MFTASLLLNSGIITQAMSIGYSKIILRHPHNKLLV